MSKSDLTLMLNPKTGGVFHVIGCMAQGTPSEIRCGFRLWLKPPGQGQGSQLSLGYRLRIEGTPDNEYPFKLTASKLWPSAKWTGSSSRHVSMAGEISVRLPFWEKAAVIESLIQADIAGRIFDHLVSTLPQMNFFLDREAFSDYLMVSLNEDYSAALSVDDCDGLVIFSPTEGNVLLFMEGQQVVLLEQSQTTPDNVPSLTPAVHEWHEPLHILPQSTPDTVKEGTTAMMQLAEGLNEAPTEDSLKAIAYAMSADMSVHVMNGNAVWPFNGGIQIKGVEDAQTMGSGSVLDQTTHDLGNGLSAKVSTIETKDLGDEEQSL